MLGKKVRALRLEKGLTQAALAGDTITRNMLSQIENGVAQPSVTTVLELAEKLETPVEYFFSETGTLADFKKMGAVEKLKKLYGAKKYSKCISALDALGVFDDETEFMYAKSLYALGLEAFKREEWQGASLFLELADTHGKRSVYIDEDFFASVKAHLSHIAEESARDDEE